MNSNKTFKTVQAASNMAAAYFRDTYGYKGKIAIETKGADNITFYCFTDLNIEETFIASLTKNHTWS